MSEDCQCCHVSLRNKIKENPMGPTWFCEDCKTEFGVVRAQVNPCIGVVPTSEEMSIPVEVKRYLDHCVTGCDCGTSNPNHHDLNCCSQTYGPLPKRKPILKTVSEEKIREAVEKVMSERNVPVYETVKVSVDIPKPPEGYGDVEYRVWQEGDCFYSVQHTPAIWIKETGLHGYVGFCARKLKWEPKEGESVLYAWFSHDKDGFVIKESMYTGNSKLFCRKTYTEAQNLCDRLNAELNKD